MHGGLFSEDGVTLEDLRKIDRNRQPPDSGKTSFQTQLRRRGLQEHNFFFFPSGPMCDLLWSDPQPQVSFPPHCISE